MQSRIAGTTPTPHSVSIIDMNTPSRAIIDPTESSIPPVIITNPRPILKIPNAPICRARFCRLIARRKLGFLIETMMQRTTKSMKIPSSFFMGLSCGAGGQMHHRLLAELRTVEKTCDASLMHYCNPIADPKHLFHFAADNDY